MRRLCFLLSYFIGSLTVVAQPYDLVLNTPESGVQIHQAFNSISFTAGYSYTASGGYMLAEIIDDDGIISGDIVYSTAIDPENYSINTSLPVGKTTGNLQVNGAATYSIPIEIPEGTNGLKPEISLNYINSYADGLVGIGCGIGGISAITRVNKTIYNDGIQDPIRADLTDKYALDGNRLLVVNGTTYGYANSEYRTEIEGFSKIVAFGSTGSGPQWFKVYTKSGLIYEFGNSENSRITNSNGCILSWKVNKISDRFNNYITFTYYSSDDERPVKTIHYTGNSATGQYPFAYIQFNYKYRSDVSDYFYGGKKFTRDILLDNIEVKYNGQSYKKYVLTYMIDTYSQLLKVTEHSSQNATLNPTVFAWTDETEQFTETTHYSSTQNERYYHGDFNGDGRTDFVVVQVKPSYTSYDKWKLYLANTSGTMVYSKNGNLNASFETFLVGDFNGDGLTDLMMQEKYPELPAYPNKKRYYFYESTGTTFTRSASYYLCYNSEGLDVVDYDGDGKLEFMFHNTSNIWTLFTYSGANICSGTIPSFGEYYIVDLKSHNRILDFNGDGCSDLFIRFSSGYKVYEFKGPDKMLIETYSGTDIKNNEFIMFGDYNGDGAIDIIKRTHYGLEGWAMFFLTEAGFQAKGLNAFDNFEILVDINRIFSYDVNADGRTDVIIIGRGQDPSNQPNRINIAISNGNGFTIQEYISSVNFQIGHYSPPYTWEDHMETKFFYFEDYKGDGRAQFFYKFSTTSKLFLFATGTPSHLVNTVIDGLGVKTTLTYRPMSNGVVYTRGSGATYPVNDFSSSMYLVSQVNEDNGIGGTSTMTYKYEGAKKHRQGKGFLVFSKTTITDVTAGILTEILSGYHNTYYYPQVDSVVKKTIGGSRIETTSNTWSELVLDATNKRIYPYVQSTNQTNVLTAHTVTDCILSMDTYGNPTQILKTYNNGINEMTVNNYLNTLNVTDWLIGRIETSTVTFSKEGEASVTKAIRYTYSINGIIKPDLIYYYENTPLAYSENHDYDSKGNLIQVYTSGSSIGASQVNYTYDANGTRLLTETDALGHTTTRTYNDYGRLHTEKDYLNNIVTYQYDVMDRPYTAVSTLGSQSTTTYIWTGGNKPALAVFGITKTGNNGSVATIWYDKLGRQIRSEKKGFNGQMILTDTEYNAKGQVYRISDPYFSGAGVVWAETFGYDEYGRTISITRNTGRNTTYSYLESKIEETTAGKSFAKYYSADGTIASAVDYGGTISYTYYPDHKVKTITAPGGIVTSILYDDAARNKTRMVDPSAGTIDYSYNSRGQIKTQTNALNQTTTYYYHPDGRPDYTVSQEGTITYTYNTNKQLMGISSPGNIGRTYGYDTNGRIISVSESIDGLVLSTTFTYDSYGRIITRTHPSGIVETLGYNNNGYVETVSTGGVTRYTITGMNAREQLTAVTYGGSLTASFGFNSYGYPTSTKTGTVQDYRYDFNAVTGNLTLRQNYLRGLSESFGYDNIERLTSVTGPQNLGVTYTNIGNINTKSDIGTTAFTYGENGAGPYALTSIVPSTSLIPSSSQEVSYTSFEKVCLLTEGNYVATFNYDSDRQRIKMNVALGGSTILTRWYAAGTYMKETAAGITREYTYIGGDAYSAPVAAVTQSGTTTYYYLLRDYLGNITHVYNASSGMVQEYSFDAWGRRRNPTDWSYNLASQPDLFAGRGFTGHEDLPWFILVNMNGRLYDPLIARFLSPDNYVQAPDFSQAFNRYSYCLNNPLVYTDPSGDFIFTILAAIFSPPLIPLAIKADATVIMGTINVIQNWDDIADKSDGKNPWVEGMAYFGIGGSSGLALATGYPFLSGSVKDGGNSLLRGYDPGTAAQEVFWGGTTSYLSAKLAAPLTKAFKGKLGNTIKSEFLKNMIAETVVSVPYEFSLSYTISRIRGRSPEEAMRRAQSDVLSAFASGIIKGALNTYNNRPTPNVVNQSAPLDVNFDPQTNLMRSLQLNQLALPPAPQIKALPPHIPTIRPGHLEFRGDRWIWIND